MRRTGVLIWILWMGLFGFTSCTDRLEEMEEQYTGENEVWVRLIVSRPYSGKEVRSKAGNDRETEIDEIQLLVFEEGGYKYRVPGISITNSGTTTSFSARLLATDKTLDLYIVANATAAVLANEPQVGDTENWGSPSVEISLLYRCPDITGWFQGWMRITGKKSAV